jgi:transposase-like protein
MSDREKTKLSPIEKAARNIVAKQLHMYGYTVNSIARIMGMHHSTVSRVVHKDFEVLQIELHELSM